MKRLKHTHSHVNRCLNETIPSSTDTEVAWDRLQYELRHCHDSVTKLNNVAVTRLQEHHPVEAILLLDHAVTILGGKERFNFESGICTRRCKSTLDSSFSMSPSSIMIHNIVFESQGPTIFSCPIDAPHSLVCVAEDKDLISSPSNDFAVYNRGFCFGNVQALDRLDSTLNAQVQPMVLLYNMGLAYQMLAVKHASSKLHEAAFQCYKMSLDLFDNTISWGTQSVPDTNLLLLALTNNLGFISSHFFNEEQAMSFAGRMLTTFATIDCPRILVKDEYVFYYMNLLFLLNRFPIFAPAA